MAAPAKRKEIKRIAKLEFMGGQAKPGPELAGLGLVMPNFTREFNDITKNRQNEPVPVTITVYTDKTHSMVVHTSPTAFKIMQAAKLEKGSSNSKTNKIATITADDVQKIAKYKMPDFNTDNLESAARSVVGTARQMGVLVEGYMDVQAEKDKALAAQRSKDEKARKAQALQDAERQAKEGGAPVETEVERGAPKAGEAAAADTKKAPDAKKAPEAKKAPAAPAAKAEPKKGGK